MYAIKCLGGLDPFFLQLPEENSDRQVPKGSCYDVTRDVSQATTETTIPALLGRLERFAKQRFATDQQMTIVRAVSTPGTTTRREVPLGTPGSKVAVRAVADRLYVRNLDGVSGEKYGDINGARLFADIPAALEAMQEFMYGRKEYACSFATLVGILESTTEPALTTEEVR